jgi:outer membrane protein
VKVGEENLKRDERQLERITESSRVGALPLADVYRQQSQVANDELDLITAQNNHDKAKADLAALIGLDPMQEYDFRDPSVTVELSAAKAETTVTQYRNLTGVTQRALAARPDLVAARANLDAAGAGITAAQSSYFPALGLSGGYGNSSDELGMLSLNKNYSLNAGVNLRWNLFDGFAREATVEQAKVTERNAEVQLRQYEKDVAVEVRKAFLDLEAAKKSWDVSEKVLVSAAEDRRIAEERYNLGAGTLLDLLVANATYVNAQAARVNSVAGFLNARYNMEFAVGDRTCEGPREH